MISFALRCYSVLVLFSLVSIKCENVENITIQLNKPPTRFNSEIYGVHKNITNLTMLKINFENVNSNLSFIVFQVHSYRNNVTLSNCSMAYGSYINGTNVGLYSSTGQISEFCILNPNNVGVQTYISVHGYNSGDPIPGGCNMEFPIPISPFLLIDSDPDYVIVKGSPAKTSLSQNCALESLTYDFYRMYLPERDFSSETYFKSLKKMLTLDNIIENGDYIPVAYPHWELRRMFSSYPGTGSIHVMVVRTLKDGRYSVYVPTHTYACEPLDDGGGCVLLDDAFSQITCASLIFVGLFLCYFGHRFFKTEMFLVGMASGFVVTYILIAVVSDLDRPGLIGASLLSGVFFGSIWLLFWWFYGMPLFAVLLASLNFGFLVGCIVFNKLPHGSQLMQVDLNFWVIFILIMVITSTLLVSMTYMANILCCSVLGAFAFIYPIDYYIGSNFKYILTNIVRRASVPKFNKAVLDPPFEWNDAILVIAWVALALTGFIYQHFQNRGKPPFPPPPRSVGPSVPLSDRLSTTYGSLGSILRSRFGNNANGIVESHERSPLLA